LIEKWDNLVKKTHQSPEEKKGKKRKGKEAL
jgi:hypothetical protein